MKKSNVISVLFFVAVCLVSCDKNSEIAEEGSVQENIEVEDDKTSKPLGIENEKEEVKSEQK